MDWTRTVFVSLALLAGSPGAEAQPSGRVARLAVFHVGVDHIPPSVHGLQEGLVTLGYDAGTTPLPMASSVIRGSNKQLDWRNLVDEAAARAAARQFALDPVDVIVAVEDQAVRAAKAATSKIPVVFLHVNAPGLARPVQGVFVLGKLVTHSMRDILPRAAERRLAVASHSKVFVSAGALFSYGVDTVSIGREAARYVDKILKGERPADLPISQATRFELVVSRKVANGLGLTIPPELLRQADQVLE